MKKRKQKTLDELTIMDDFMFGAVMSQEKYCKPLLEKILGVKLTKIKYLDRQKDIDVEYEAKGIRLDIYCEDDKNNLYDVEIQTTNKRNLPLRTRYYQSMVDIDILKKGKDYKKLKNSFIIFICNYDPFKQGRHIYEFKNYCSYDKDLELGDMTTKIILNTKGTMDDVSTELKEVLNFIDGQIPLMDYTKQLESAVQEVKDSEQWRVEYMTMLELKQEAREEEDKKIMSILSKAGLTEAIDLLESKGVNLKMYADEIDEEEED